MSTGQSKSKKKITSHSGKNTWRSQSMKKDGQHSKKNTKKLRKNGTHGNRKNQSPAPPPSRASSMTRRMIASSRKSRIPLLPKTSSDGGKKMQKVTTRSTRTISLSSTVSTMAIHGVTMRNTGTTRKAPCVGSTNTHRTRKGNWHSRARRDTG